MFGRGGALLAALTLAVTAMAAPAAQARVIQFTVNGTVSHAEGVDPVFGASNDDLVGLGYVAVFRFDTNIGGGLKSNTFESVFGGWPNDFPSPSLGGKITINGVTLFVAGSYKGSGSTVNGGAFASTIQNIEDRDDGGINHATLYSEIRTFKPSTIGTSFDAPFTYEVDPQDRVRSYIQSQRYAPENVLQPNRWAELQLKPQTIRFEPVGVPEPATWALLICGFGVAGASLRRRRAVALG